MKPKYILEVKVPLYLEIPIVLCEEQGKDVYGKGRGLEQILQKLFPGLEIRLSTFETRKGKNRFYEMRMKCSPENAERFGWVVERISKEFLDPRELGIRDRKELEGIQRLIEELEKATSGLNGRR